MIEKEHSACSLLTSLLLVLGSLFRTSCSVTLVVAHCTHPCKLAILCNGVLAADGLAIIMALKNLTDTFRGNIPPLPLPSPPQLKLENNFV